MANESDAIECHICHRPLDRPGELWCSAGHPLPQAGDDLRAAEALGVDPTDPGVAGLQEAVVRIRALVNEANDRLRHPIDLNYVAVEKDAWEELVGMVNRRV
jgi:hypothetical protein